MSEAEEMAELAILQGLVEEEDAPAADDGSDAARGEEEGLILGKFKDEAALEASYKELNRAYTQSQQELRAAQSELAALEAQAYAQGGVFPQGGIYDHEQQGDFGLPAEATDPVDRLLMLGEVTAAAVRAQAGAPPPNPNGQFEHVVGALAERFPDFIELEPRIMQTLQENPAALGPDPAAIVNDPVQLQAALAAAYVSVKNADAQNGANRMAKMQAQTLSGTTGRPEPVSDDDAYVQRIFNADMGRYK